MKTQTNSVYNYQKSYSEMNYSTNKKRSFTERFIEWFHDFLDSAE